MGQEHPDREVTMRGIATKRVTLTKLFSMTGSTMTCVLIEMEFKQ